MDRDSAGTVTDVHSGLPTEWWYFGNANWPSDGYFRSDGVDVFQVKWTEDGDWKNITRGEYEELRDAAWRRPAK